MTKMCAIYFDTTSDGRCRPISSSLASAEHEKRDKSMTKEGLSWPSVHPLLALAGFIFAVPSWVLMNRGFTLWFHLGFLFYLVTGRSDFMRRFQVIIGGATNIGWYLTVVHEYVVHGRLFDLLYNNMPPAMKAIMLENGHLASGGIIQNNTAMATIWVTHVLDMIAHPFLLYVAWKMHVSYGGSARNLVTWDVLIAAYAFRIVYSTSHQYYNWGYVNSPFYYGFEVYHIDSLDAYTAAYVGEAIWFAVLIAWKGYLSWLRSNDLRVKLRIGAPKRSANKNVHSQKSAVDPYRSLPVLRKSSSSFSIHSTATITSVPQQ